MELSDYIVKSEDLSKNDSTDHYQYSASVVTYSNNNLLLGKNDNALEYHPVGTDDKNANDLASISNSNRLAMQKYLRG